MGNRARKPDLVKDQADGKKLRLIRMVTMVTIVGRSSQVQTQVVCSAWFVLWVDSRRGLAEGRGGTQLKFNPQMLIMEGVDILFRGSSSKTVSTVA